MDNKRMKQIIFMFSEITGEPPESAKQIILQTKTGNDIKSNNPAVMYEQQTENLYSIAMELKDMKGYSDISVILSNDNIVLAMKKLHQLDERKWSESVSVTAKRGSSVDKEKMKELLLGKRKEALQIKQQNQINVGRIEHANKFKG